VARNLPAPPRARREGLAQLADTRLWYTDAGGTGPAVVFLHPASGSALVWGRYQQPAFAAAGYRIIAYSRRSHYNSDPEPETDPGIGSQDVHQLIEFLGLAKFQLCALRRV
jgi:pimeloyl-ACP methyl ester carboxylesterase